MNMVVNVDGIPYSVILHLIKIVRYVVRIHGFRCRGSNLIRIGF